MDWWLNNSCIKVLWAPWHPVPSQYTASLGSQVRQKIAQCGSFTAEPGFLISSTIDILRLCNSFSVASLQCIVDYQDPCALHLLDACNCCPSLVKLQVSPEWLNVPWGKHLTHWTPLGVKEIWLSRHLPPWMFGVSGFVSVCAFCAFKSYLVRSKGFWTAAKLISFVSLSSGRIGMEKGEVGCTLLPNTSSLHFTN